MSGVTESQFYMWRTIFAMAHADHVVTSEEVRYMAEALETVPFSDAQKKILNEDIKTPQDIVRMFAQIVDVQDQSKFFNFARQMVWVDGDFGLEEQHVMQELQRIHAERANVDEMIGHVDLQLEEEEQDTSQLWPSGGKPGSSGLKGLIEKFIDQFH